MALSIDDADAALYTIGQVADMLGVQPAFLRRLDAHGIVVPARSAGGQRRYSRREIDRVAEVMDLVAEGVTLAGVRRVLTLRERVGILEEDLAAARAAAAPPEERSRADGQGSRADGHPDERPGAASG
ncbi:MerR family transcriptional regulator [Streptomyces cynarae]|uniref:MerR family transcriptional regulator n=1 Tax=Streptomyces cynarae TaxID=2981134 RepID=UPI00406CC835